ncbi:hypothetical protein GJ654_18875 [Rhodoblastus acidophilus]|uniref:Right handed beta helix region n=1 Tax=Rhodoblastus acidophilus TaxID=1074 RepID=A0A6N8DRX2_RHOAC|nr:hypothetical protein [Rhodoblastus acidophilus]MCW2276393.1 hypothetical protein [Rhodoblastus acidophilus]MTV33048.1 hypothetical protein [Rhodoblastus acidophilus]
MKITLLLIALLCAAPALAAPGTKRILGVGDGGTGAEAASAARSNLGAASRGANSDITSINGLTMPLSTGQGGTASATGDLSAMTATVNVLRGYGALPAPVCNGAADDRTALRAIITAAAGNARVLIPASVTCRADLLTLPSNSHLTVDGTLKAPDGIVQTVIQIGSGASNVVIDGSGVIDGNRNNTTGANGAAGGISSGPTASNVQIRGVTIQGARMWPLNLVGVSGCSVTDVTMRDSTNSAEFAAGSNNCWASRLKISNIDNDGSFVFYKGVWNSGITDSVIEGGFVSGIGVYNDNDTQTLSHDLVIANNILRGNGRVGLEVSVGTRTDQTRNHYNIKIKDNVLVGNGTQNLSLGDIALSAIERSDISGNSSFSYGGASTSPAIKIALGANALTIENNKIFNPGPGGASGVCFQFAPGTTAERWIIRNNTCIDNQETRTVAYGFLGKIPTKSQVHDNRVINTIGGFGPLSEGSSLAFGWKGQISNSDQIAALNYHTSTKRTTALQMRGDTDSVSIGGIEGSPKTITLSTEDGDNAGKIVVNGALHHGGAAWIDPINHTEDNTAVVSAGRDNATLINTTLIPAFTVLIPPLTGANGQIFRLSSDGGVTSMTVKDSDGNSISGSPTTLAAGVGRTFLSDGSAWHVQ